MFSHHERVRAGMPARRCVLILLVVTWWLPVAQAQPGPRPLLPPPPPPSLPQPQPKRVPPTTPDQFFNEGLACQAAWDLDGAIAAYTGAIELDPQSVGSFVNRGNAKRKKEDFTGAIADYNQVLKLRPGHDYALRNRADVYFLSRQWTNSLADYRRLCEVSDWQDYPRVYIWLIRSRLGEVKEANLELSKYLEDERSRLRGDWFQQIAEFLLDRRTDAQLLDSAAKSYDQVLARGRGCEARFFCGMKKLLAGDKAAAGEFRQCLATQQRAFTEYDMAQAELKALEQGKNLSSP